MLHASNQQPQVKKENEYNYSHPVQQKKKNALTTFDYLAQSPVKGKTLEQGKVRNKLRKSVGAPQNV